MARLPARGRPGLPRLGLLRLGLLRLGLLRLGLLRLGLLRMGLLRLGLLAAVVAAVTGCVGMPAGGPAQEFTPGPASTAPDVNFIGPFPSGPRPGESADGIVQGFLLASAGYPTYSVAQDYLVGSAVKAWNPGWAVTVFSNLAVPNPVPAPGSGAGTGGPQTTVNVTGTVQASFNGSGQYVSAQSQGQAAAAYPFDLVKVNGQWRITNPPDFRMLTTTDFLLFYKAQDLYFFDPQGEVLVPDPVFVPLGATASQLIDNLVNALTADPKTLWLQDATDTEFPSSAKVLGITLNGSTVTVNLGGRLASGTARQLELFAAQLVWTLTSSPASPPNIQSVVLETNGQPWAPGGAPCPGDRSPGSVQTQAAYQCFDPYQSSPASFYYVDRGQAWGRCGWQTQAQALQGLIGSVVPLAGRNGVFDTQRCGQAGYVSEESTAAPPAQPGSLPAVSMVAVSPDGKYLALVSAARNAVYVAPLSGTTASFPSTPRLTGADVTAISWDRSDELWVAQNGNVLMLPAVGKGTVPVAFDGSVSALSVAPDGVRIALAAQVGGLGPGLYLAAIGAGQQNTNQLSAPSAHLSIRTVTSVGPNLTDPASLAWYDADDLIVLNDAVTGNSLYEVPVDGHQAQALQVTPPGTMSITADGSANNVLVAGLSGGTLAVSTGLAGPWYQLGNPGQAPAYSG